MRMRYKIRQGSQSAHCCFAFTIVDSENPEGFVDQYGYRHYDVICEAFEQSEAELVCAALNGGEFVYLEKEDV